MDAVAIPETISNSVQLGAGVVLLLSLSLSPRVAPLFPLLVLALAAWATHIGVLSPVWALESFLLDAPWSGVLRIGVMQLVMVALAGAMLRWRLGRPLWVAMASPLLAAHPAVRSRFLAELPDPSERAGVVLLGGSLALLVPALSPAAGLLGWYADPVAAAGVLVIGLGGWWAGRAASRAASRSGSGAGDVAPAGAVGPYWPWRPLGVLMSVVPGFGMLAWIAAASGAMEFVADALEHAHTYVPRLTDAIFTLGAVIAGAVGDEGAYSLIGAGILDRALSLRGETVREILLAGISVGGTLPMLLATSSRMKVGLPWWFAQIVWLVGWYVFH